VKSMGAKIGSGQAQNPDSRSSLAIIQRQTADPFGRSLPFFFAGVFKRETCASLMKASAILTRDQECLHHFSGAEVSAK
jgi:hypothetical protein